MRAKIGKDTVLFQNKTSTLLDFYHEKNDNPAKEVEIRIIITKRGFSWS